MYALLLSAALAPPSQSAAPAAMVLTTKGMVVLERANEKPRRLAAMTLLRPGDRVQVPEGSEATLVFLEDGHRERLGPRVKATVAGKGCQPAEVAQRLEGPKLAPANLESLRDLANSSRGAVGVLRGDGPSTPQRVTPLYGAGILTDRPALTWPDIRADAYLVQLLSGAEGKEQRLLWKSTVKEPRLTYPSQEKPLQFGKLYRWRVTPLKGEDATADPLVSSKFQVLTKYEIALLANLKPLVAGNAPADLLLTAVSFESHGVYDEALRLYERLAALTPEEANFQNTLAIYYERAGRKDLAQKARAEAKKLE